MRFAIKVLLFSSVALLFSACSKAPGNDTEQTGKILEIPDNVEQYVSLDEAAKQLEQIENSRYRNYTFPSIIMKPGETHAAEFSVSAPDISDDLHESENCLKEMWPYFDEMDMSKTDFRDSSVPGSNSPYKGHSYINETDGYACGFDNSGFMCGDNLMDLTTQFAKPEVSYNLLCGDVLEEDKGFQLKDGYTVIREAQSYVEEKFNTVFKAFEGDCFDYKVNRVFISKNKADDSYYCQFVVGRYVDGMPLDTSGSYIVREGIYYDRKFNGKGIIVIMSSKDNIVYFNTQNYSLHIAKTNDCDKIISPLWAVKNMYETIAESRDVVFEQCGLMYMLQADNEYYIEGKKRGVEIKKQGISINPWTDTSLMMRPYWVFMSPPSSDGSYGRNDRHSFLILVDAVTGEVFFFDYTTD